MCLPFYYKYLFFESVVLSRHSLEDRWLPPLEMFTSENGG